LATAIEVVPRRMGQTLESRMSPVQAVQQIHLIPLFPEQGPTESKPRE
jgi:hypothetical protein